MTLFELISREAASERRQLALASALAGVANPMLLVVINTAVDAPEEVDAGSFIVFGALLVLYVMCSRRAHRRMTAILEAALHRVKVRVGEQVARAELEALERVHAAEICDRITESTEFISERAGLISGLIQSSLILAAASLYIAWLSPPAFAVIALLCVAGGLLFNAIRRDFIAYMQETADIRVSFSDRLRDLLLGFKEAKQSRSRSRELGDEIVALSGALRDVNGRSGYLYTKGLLLGEVTLFAVLAMVVFFLQARVALDGPTVARLVAAVMFLWGPLIGLIVGILPYARANLVLAQIESLERRLTAAVQADSPAGEEDPWRGRFTTIEARALEYTYDGAGNGDAFHIGPIDLTLRSGEIVFIVGGNGSGKSTLLKVLTGLYPLRTGALEVDGTPVVPANAAWLREMVSAIFSDFHLFARLHGVAGVDEGTVQRLLERMRLDGKTSFTKGRFTKLTLSTGQRKRLAMIVALLEGRPLCVFDEWAADQDPEYRRYFYEELLPLLRQEGKTVIVVSHDDRYFHCADRVVTMEYGKVRSIEGGAPRAAAS